MMKTSIHIKPANLGPGGCGSTTAEGHAYREQWYMDALEKSPHYDLISNSDNNEVIVNEKAYPDGLAGLLQRDIAEAKAHNKHGRAPSTKPRTRLSKKQGTERNVPGWAPIREGVVVIKPDTVANDFHPFFLWLKKKGIGVISLAIHRDEGHVDALTGEVVINHHAHVFLDFMDHNKGKTIKLDKAELREMQTQLAQSLGMERGDSREETLRPHLPPQAYRAKAMAEEIQKLERMAQEEQDKLSALDLDIDKRNKELDYLNNRIDEANAALNAIQIQKEDAEKAVRAKKQESEDIARQIANLKAERSNILERIGGSRFSKLFEQHEILKKQLETTVNELNRTKATIAQNAKFVHEALDGPASKEEALIRIRREAAKQGLKFDQIKTEELYGRDYNPLLQPLVMRDANNHQYWAIYNQNEKGLRYQWKSVDENCPVNDGWADTREAARRLRDPLLHELRTKNKKIITSTPDLQKKEKNQ